MIKNNSKKNALYIGRQVYNYFI